MFGRRLPSDIIWNLLFQMGDKAENNGEQVNETTGGMGAENSPTI